MRDSHYLPEAELREICRVSNKLGLRLVVSFGIGSFAWVDFLCVVGSGMGLAFWYRVSHSERANPITRYFLPHPFFNWG
jgi:hypothetical protein